MKIGIIGAGNMATAIIKGITGFLPPGDIFVSNKSPEKLENFKKTGINTGSNTDAAIFGDVIILAVKPDVYEGVLNEIRPYTGDKIIVSIAAGISIGYIKGILGNGQKVVRTMPNTPALVGEGMTSISFEEPVTERDADAVKNIFSSFGNTIIIPETLMDAAVSVGGSSPAYFFMMIDAMAKSAESMGMNREDAVKAAAQSMLGAAKMVLETGEPPIALTKKVCSPGGTTIEAVNFLNKSGFENIIQGAMKACADKSRKMKR